MSVSADGQAGFSLVEMLMTVFVLSLVTGLIMATLPANPPPALREARRLEAQIETAMLEARTGGRKLGLVVMKEGYFLAVWRDGKWQELPGSAYQLRGPVRLLEVDSPPRDEPRPDGWPALVFDPLFGTGRAQFEFLDTGRAVRVEIGPEGQARLVDHAK